MAPVLVPMKQSNRSLTLCPVALSNKHSSSIWINPLTPPPSRDKTRYPAAAAVVVVAAGNRVGVVQGDSPLGEMGFFSEEARLFILANYNNNNTQNAAVAPRPSTTHPLVWAEQHQL